MWKQITLSFNRAIIEIHKPNSAERSSVLLTTRGKRPFKIHFLQVASADLSGLAWAGPGRAMLCMYGNGRGTAPPSLPTHHREFVYISLLPSSCQEAPQRGTADYSVLLATPSFLEWPGFSTYSIGWCFVAALRFKEVSSSISVIMLVRTHMPRSFQTPRFERSTKLHKTSYKREGNLWLQTD